MFRQPDPFLVGEFQVALCGTEGGGQQQQHRCDKSRARRTAQPLRDAVVPASEVVADVDVKAQFPVRVRIAPRPGPPSSRGRSRMVLPESEVHVRQQATGSQQHPQDILMRVLEVGLILGQVAIIIIET